MTAFACRLHVWACWAFLALLPVQFLLAGMGVLGGNLEVHMAFGSIVLHLVIPVILLLSAGMGRMGWRQSLWAVGLFLLLTVQTLVVGVFEEPILRGLHPALALLSWPYVYFGPLRRAASMPRAAAVGAAS